MKILKMDKDKGFTLVEFLVVIAIVTVLTGVLVVAINPAAILAKGRDDKRLYHMDNLYKALVLAEAQGEIALRESSGDSVSGVPSVGDGDADGYTDGWVSVEILAEKTGLAKYLPELPVDPLHPSMSYSYASDGTSFELNCVLESADYITRMSVDGGDNNNVYEVGSSLLLIN
jgi:prepilin-type N-terminal cleavage/methylation domain-containing protein